MGLHIYTNKKKQVVRAIVFDICTSDSKGAESDFRMWVKKKNNKT